MTALASSAGGARGSDGAALEATLQEVRDRLPLSVSSAVPSLAADGMRVRPVPSGAQTINGSTSIVFATDHPPVDAALIVNGAAVAVDNPVPVVGVQTRKTANGTRAPATSETLVNAPAALVGLHIWYLGNVARYIMLFDTDQVAGISDANLVLGSGFELDTSSRRKTFEFSYPIGFGSGVTWGISDSPIAWVPSTRTAVVSAQYL